MKWKIRANRFVIFIDILGFKDLVARESHENVLNKLKAITTALEYLSNEKTHKILKEERDKIEADQTRAITFSDSVAIFSKSDTVEDAFKIICDAHALQVFSLENGVPIKGAISFGEITVDFEKNLFFGQPIIDAYLLHEDLHMLSIILDHLSEAKINSYKDSLQPAYKNVYRYDTKMKYGTTTHSVVRTADWKIKETLGHLENLYKTVSGKPRVYIDNTVLLYKKLQVNIPKKKRK